MADAWVIVADKSQARIFRAKSPKAELDEFQVLEHPRSRLKASELMSDGLGRMPDQGSHRSAMDAPTDPQEHEANLFARRLVDSLEAGRADHSYDRLYVVAPPSFLGTLRRLYSPPLAGLVRAEVDKNLIAQRPEAIREQLPYLL